MEYKGWTLEAAAEEVIMKKLPKMGGDGGIIAIDNQGNIVFKFNTEGMYRASISSNGTTQIQIFKD
jgi:beta-aspartyl-peptidase (threonine type)